MTRVLDVVLLTVFVLATSVWVGGIVTITVVARVAARTLTAADGVALFRRLGRAHGIVGTVALLVGLLTGAALLRHRDWSGPLTATAVVAAAVLAATGIGIAQARRMTVLRQAALQETVAETVRADIERSARNALLLRALIGLLTIALVTLGAVVATGG